MKPRNIINNTQNSPQTCAFTVTLSVPERRNWKDKELHEIYARYKRTSLWQRFIAFLKENYSSLWRSRTKINMTPVIRNSITCNSLSNSRARHSNTKCKYRTCSREYFKLCLSRANIWENLNISCNINEPREKKNWQKTELSNSANYTRITAEARQTYYQ